MKRGIKQTLAAGVALSTPIRPELRHSFLLIVTGMLLGPYGLGFVRNDDTARTFAELGALLIFLSVGSGLRQRAKRASRQRWILGLLKLGLAVGVLPGRRRVI